MLSIVAPFSRCTRVPVFCCHSCGARPCRRHDARFAARQAPRAHRPLPLFLWPTQLLHLARHHRLHRRRRRRRRRRRLAACRAAKWHCCLWHSPRRRYARRGDRANHLQSFLNHTHKVHRFLPRCPFCVQVAIALVVEDMRASKRMKDRILAWQTIPQVFVPAKAHFISLEKPLFCVF